MIISTL